MGAYVIRRLLQFIPVVFGTLFLLHYLTTLGIQFNGDPVAALFGPQQPPPQVLAALREQFNLNDPCLRRSGDPCFGLFFDRLGNYAHGDFGTDYQRQPVTDLLGRAAPITIRLTIIAITVEAVFGIAAGVLAGIRKDGFFDNLSRLVTVLLIAIPVFVLGLMVQIASGLWIGEWLEGQSWAPDWLHMIFSVTYQPDAPWLSLIVPGFVLGGFSVASVLRLTRTSLVENLRSDYVRTAKAKGLSRSRVVGVHTLRNSLIPVVTYLGIDVGFLINGALVTEGIFNIPGVGGLVFQAVRAQEVLVVISVATVLTMLFLVANLVVDILYAVLDPRIRYE